MNVLSLFDGVSAGQSALNRIGIEIDNYYASEIDPYPIMMTRYNYPNTVQLGDVTKWREWEIPNIDILFAGFPCQAWSIAGKQGGDEDPRGALVHDLIDIWKHYKPTYFLFENVKMKKEFMDYVNDLFQCDWALINSALLSAQNRERYYWTNIPGLGMPNLMGDYPIEQPKDKGIILRDILEENVSDNINIRKSEKKLLFENNGKMFIKENTKKGYTEINNGDSINFSVPNSKTRRGRVGKQKAQTLDTQCNQGTLIKSNKPIQVGMASDINGHDYCRRIYSPKGKMRTLTAGGGGNQEGNIAINETINKGGKAYSLTANYNRAVAWNSAERKQRTMAITENEVNPANEYKGLKYRKLTPLECERLQTMDDDFTKYGVDDKGNKIEMSKTRRYHAIGNSWTVDVICHILQGI